jgi:hypothetical protein
MAGRPSFPETSVMESISRATVGACDGWSAGYSSFIAKFLDRTSQGGVDPWLQIVAAHAKVVI